MEKQKKPIHYTDPNYTRDSNLNPDYEYKVALFHGLGKFSVHKQTGKVCECKMTWNEDGTILSCPICGLDGT
jgi:hypothetical protein